MWWAWIRDVISSARVSIHVNDTHTDKFRMERGIRQGDPILPFLFIITAKGLWVMMDESIQKGLFQRFKIHVQAPIISTFQYADDAFILVECQQVTAKT